MDMIAIISRFYCQNKTRAYDILGGALVGSHAGHVFVYAGMGPSTHLRGGKYSERVVSRQYMKLKGSQMGENSH